MLGTNWDSGEHALQLSDRRMRYGMVANLTFRDYA
jgi:hypothetical protein